MKRKRWSGIGVVSIALSTACRAQSGPAGCASTPAAAIEVVRAATHTGLATEAAAASITTGFRVESMRWDAAQRRTWAIIRSCDHAERPTLAMLADLPREAGAPPASLAPTAPAPVASLASIPAAAASSPSAQIAVANSTAAVVHAGEVVRLWRADGLAHIELTALAEENGAAGAKVRLRLMTPKDADGQYAPPRYFAGIVRGPADVEMEP